MQKKSLKLWEELWQRIGSDDLSLASTSALIIILAEYQAAGRFYHTFTHVENCIAEFQKARHLADDPDVVEFALWFHDVVYNPVLRNNEEESAKFAMEIGDEAGISKEFLQRVAALIMATKHAEIPDFDDGRLIVDIDLAILGQSEEVFDKYEEDIREEYSWVREDVFRSGRAEILQSFLDRHSIYCTQFFSDKYEAQARRNLTLSIEKLKHPN
ncbi:MAG: N-methyl-D-aspartate receptor NMDAR2C subunit [Patescibacteria group bacterium]